MLAAAAAEVAVVVVGEAVFVAEDAALFVSLAVDGPVHGVGEAAAAAAVVLAADADADVDADVDAVADAEVVVVVAVAGDYC